VFNNYLNRVYYLGAKVLVLHYNVRRDPVFLAWLSCLLSMLENWVSTSNQPRSKALALWLPLAPVPPNGALLDAPVVWRFS